MEMPALSLIVDGDLVERVDALVEREKQRAQGRALPPDAKAEARRIAAAKGKPAADAFLAERRGARERVNRMRVAIRLIEVGLANWGK